MAKGYTYLSKQDQDHVDFLLKEADRSIDMGNPERCTIYLRSAKGFINRQPNKEVKDGNR